MIRARPGLGWKHRDTRRSQRGQSLLEYSLISCTVVMAFAVAHQLGFSDRFAEQIDHSQDVYYIQIPNDVTDLGNDVNAVLYLNTQISLR